MALSLSSRPRIIESCSFVLRCCTNRLARQSGHRHAGYRDPRRMEKFRLQYAYFYCGAAEYSGRPVRGGAHRRRRRMETICGHHDSDARTHDSFCGDDYHYRLFSIICRTVHYDGRGTDECDHEHCFDDV